MSIDKYDPIRVLGEGSFGKVYLMRDKVRRTFVCVKIIKIKNIPKKEREATKIEVDLLRRLHHPNIVRYIDSFLSKNNESLCICMEYCDGGDLASQVKAARRNLFSEAKILHWFVQIALGLHYMHNNKVLHRDLKTQNVFLLGNGRLVLGDLGISKVLDGTMDFAQTCIGTPYYMSPEIFKNKPYSYKSDVWALGCVLYEMTTLTHAFDANSLNGLACKIIKGRYPPIHHKYSKFLRDLIGDMLLINPQQRPDLDQILRKPFIKKHIVNFFTDIAARPSASLGEGTMIVRAAVGGPSAGALGSDSNMLSLRQQLQMLDMMDAVNEALAPKATPVDPNEAKKMAREQAGALRREEEHKNMVEVALEKLRIERETRAKERLAMAAKKIAGPQPNAAGPSSGAGAVAGLPNRQDPSKAAASRQSQAAVPVARAPAQVVPAAAAELRRDPSNMALGARPTGAGAGGMGGAAAGGEAMNWGRRGEAGAQAQPIVAAAAAVQSSAAAGKDSRASVSDSEKRRRSFGENQDRINDRDKKASDDRKRLIAIQEQESRDREKAEERRREEVRLEARNREEARLREEAQRRDEAASKQKLDQQRAQADAASRRDVQRDRERQRQQEEVEQLRRDKLELDRRTAERERLREERRVEEQKRIENARRDQLNVMQDKLGAMQDQVRKLDIRPRAEDKDDGSSTAKDRVIQRKQEKLAREEMERVEALREAENDNRRFRQAANSQHRNQYQSDGIAAVLPNEHGHVRRHASDNSAAAGSSAADYAADDKPGYEFEPAAGRGAKARQHQPSRASSENMNMDLDELSDRLSDVTRGKQSRYDASYNEDDSQIGSRPTIRMGGGQQLFERDDEIDSEEDEEHDDTESLWERRDDPGTGVDEEEDLERKEEELKSELTMATLRCEELKRTLENTKSFMGVRPGANGPVLVTGAGAPVAINNSAHKQQQPGGVPKAQYEEEFEDDDEEEEELEHTVEFSESTNYEDSWGPADRLPPRPNNKHSGENANRSGNITNENNNRDDSTIITPRRQRPSAIAVKDSPFYNLQDPPTPSGRLIDRIERLKQRCIEALGREAFFDAYAYLKAQDECAENGMYDDDNEDEKLLKIRAILGDVKMHYAALIEQLIFMETAN